MRFRISYVWILILGALQLLASCRKTEDLIDFTEEDEIALGEKLAEAIEQDLDFKIIPTDGNSVSYGYANSRIAEIVSTSVISKGEDFVWTIHFVDDDERQAFAFPGGHIYVSTGMIFFLDNEDQFSGLLAHLVAHVDQSHITETLFFKYGVNNLKSIATLGNAEDLKSITNDLELTDDFLQFTRGNEIQADTLAISMLSETGQSCESGGLFISKILNVQSNQQSKFIAAHQLLDARLDNINDVVSTFGCTTVVDDESALRYQSFRNSLP